jgi:hypothetical protein
LKTEEALTFLRIVIGLARNGTKYDLIELDHSLGRGCRVKAFQELHRFTVTLLVENQDFRSGPKPVRRDSKTMN